MVRRVRGELESEVLRRLWALDGPVTSRALREGFAEDARPALTTLLTILERLERKGLVRREPGPGASLFSASRSESAQAASAMEDALAAVSDRESALVHFAGRLSDADVAALRKALGAS